MTQSEFLKSIRQYFWNLNFTEIEIPYLNSSLPLEPNLYSFKTTWSHKNQDYFLPTSPEFALKKYLARNHQNCFAISHCFRDLEDEGPDHTPEFLMLEWYEINKDLNDLMLSTQKFLKKYLNIKFSNFALPKNLPDNEPDFNQFFLNEVEPKLNKNEAIFVTGYPSFLSPLAKSVIASEAKQSLRFELYINGTEIANGCTENTNSDSILKAFEKEKQYRLQNKLPFHSISSSFATNSAKIGQVSGIGLGIDRILKIITKTID
ncbi:MAG TPA: amino acid--tRNA ligase-related protein [Candidatus Methanoperedens sp.]|nr:amino acid--tRNA ligase-related protein [Candidatus Methanoperedens sp.]